MVQNLESLVESFALFYLWPVLKKVFLRIIIRKMSNCGIVLEDNK